jgi:carbon-monoxide dehydrogenase iron sulfur subunit
MLKKKFTKDKCVTCKHCMIACAVRHSASQNIYDAVSESPQPRYRLWVSIRKDKPFMTVCQNCVKPKCIPVCKEGAIAKSPVDGEVIIDTKKCNGCMDCVKVCAMGAISINTELNFAFNCDDCAGYPDMACVEACHTGALTYAEKAKEKAKEKAAPASPTN